MPYRQPSRLTKHSSHLGAAVIATILLAVMLGLTLGARPAAADGVVHLYYFYDPVCHACQEVHRDVLEPLQAEYGDRIAIEERDVTDMANMELMLNLEQQFRAPFSSIPEVIIGEEVLPGPVEIEHRLRDRIEHYLAQGGVALPVVATFPTPTTDAECPECEDIHSAARATAADRAAEAQRQDGVVHVVLFWSETCPFCHTVIDEVLPPLQERYGMQLEVTLVNISTQDGRALWVGALDAARIPADRQAVPMLFIGERMLLGGREIPDMLPGLIEQYLAAGGIGLPPYVGFDAGPAEGATPPTTTEAAPLPPAMEGPEPPPAVHAVYFYQPGCDVCDRAEHDLRYITGKYPQVVIDRYDVRAYATLNQYLCDRYGVPEDKHLTAPAFFVGNGYLLGDAIRAPTIEVLVAPLLRFGAPSPAGGWGGQQEAAVETIVERFRSLGLLTVVGAGLLDGVNPCAFATMIFLISYLSLRKRTGTALLATGAAFTSGVFLTYLGVGFGFLRFLSSLPFLHVIGKWIYGVTALLCIALAVGSILDYRKAREGRLEEMSLKLPSRLRNLSKKLIREGASAQRFVLSSFVLGIGVSIVELACTGQVYLPTIIFVLGLPEWRAQAGLLLVLYNVMFIVPLVGVFLLVYFGTTSQQLIDWMTRNTAGVKLGTAALFLLLAGWLSYSIVYL